MIKFKKHRKVALALAIVFAIGSFATCPSLPTYAKTIEEIREQQQETRKKKEEAQKKLGELNSLKADVVAVIQELDNQISAYEIEINNLTGQLNEVQAQISVTELNLKNANTLEAEQYNSMKERIQYAYENGDVAYLNALMATTHFEDIVNQSEYVEQVSDYDKQQLEALMRIKQQIVTYEDELEVSREEVELLREAAENEKAALEVMEEAKKEKLAEYNVMINDTQSNISKLEQDEANMEAEIREIERQAELRRQEAERKRKEEEEARRRQQNPDNPPAPSPEPLPAYSGGKFVWPMPASRNITSQFGPRNRPTAGASSYHKGIDIACPSGSTVVAAASGVVTYTGWTSGGGNSVMIDHGGMTTVYFHLSGYAVSAGQSVSAGQCIAYSGNTGVSTGPHLHFGVRVNGSYVNPWNYF